MSSNSFRMTPDERRGSISLALIFALRMLGFFIILPVFAVHAQTLPGGNNAVLVGWALGIYGLTQGLLQIPFGAASDRFGRKPVIVIGLVLFAFGSFVAAAADDIVFTIIGRALQGAGAVAAAITAFIADITREEQRTKAMAMVGGSIALTFALSLVAAPPLYQWIGMSGLFVMTGMASMLAIAVVIWIVPQQPKLTHAATETGRRAWVAVLLHPELLRLNFGSFVLHVVQMSIFVFLPLVLIERGGLPLPQHWQVYLPVVLLSFALMTPPVLWADRYGQKKPLFLFAIALMAFVMLGFLWFAPSLWMLAFWLLLFFVGFNIMEALLASITSRVAPPAQRGLALGIYNMTRSLGLFTGGVAGGALVKYAGQNAVWLGSAVLLALWFIAALSMRPIPKHGTTKQQAVDGPAIQSV